MLKKLRAQRRRAERKLKRRQKIRGRVLHTEKWARRQGLKALASQCRATAKNLHKQIDDLHDRIRKLNREIEKREKARDNDREDFVKWCLSKVGVVEGSAEMRGWAADMGASALWPWCSTFVGYGLKHVGGFAGRLPSGVPYSGSWLSWSHGNRVSYSQAQPGDLLIFDWGDGGMTDHVAVYVGGGLKVGGNENNRVEKDAVPSGAIVGVVRPDWND